MKKLINLIALVMLVSVNVLTPFSYADVEDFVDNVENIENEVENSEEYEETLPVVEEIINDNEPQGLSWENEIFEDSQATTSWNILEEEIEDGEITQYLEVLTETGAEGDGIDGWESIDEEENIDELGLQKAQESTTMGVISWTSTTLLPWQQFNVAIKKLSGQSSARYSTSNTTIKQIVYTWSIPSWATTWKLSTDDSQYPVYGWFTWWIIYYTTQAETIYLNSNSSYMFYYMKWLTWLDLTNLNTSNVTNMGSMFSSCSKLTSLNLSGWDTNKVTDMSYMFNYCSSLGVLYVSTWFVTTWVISFNDMFYNDTNIVWWNLTRYNSSKTDKEYARIDKPWQKWYFTDINAIIVRFMIGWEEYKTQSVEFWKKANKPENPYRTWATFEKWVDKNWEEFDFVNTEIRSYMELYAKFSSGWDAILLPWSEFNVMIKKLAWNSSATYSSTNNNISGIVYTWNIPAWVTTWVISSPYSENEVVAWFTWWVLYYTTQADIIYLNSDSSYMFEELRWLTSLDLSNWNTSRVTSMRNMFYRCIKLTSLNLSGWDTSNVTDMYNMFFGCSGLIWLDLSSFDTSNVTDMSYMFGYCGNLKTICVSTKFLTINVANSSYMFNDDSKLVWWNLTRYNSYKTNQEYARIDKPWQKWYFTDVNAIIVRFMIGWEEYKTQSVEFWKKANKPENPYRTWATFEKWIDKNWGEFDFVNTEITSYTELYAKFSSGWDAILLPWSEFNVKIKQLAWNSGATTYGYVNTWIKQIVQWTWNSIPVWVITWVISSSYSENEVIAWFTWWVLYYTTQADIIYLNPDSSFMFYLLRWLTGLDVSKWNTSKVENMSEMFDSCESLTSLDLSGWDTSNVTNMSYMFYDCKNLEYLNLNWWDFRWLGSSLQMRNVLKLTSKLTKLDMENTKFTWSMYGAFQWLNIVEEINLSGADTSNVTDMSMMFYYCQNLVEIKWLDTLDTSSVTNMNSMFEGCYNLNGFLDLSSWDTKNVIDMGEIFWSCYSLTGLNLNGWNTSKVTKMYSMFSSCTWLEELNLSGWDFRWLDHSSYLFYQISSASTPLKRLNMANTKFAWSMEKVFYDLRNLEKLELDWVDTSNVTDMRSMFYDCKNLVEIKWLDSLDTSNVTDIGSMFYNCSGLTNLDLSSFDTSHVTDMTSMFYNCTNLETIYVSTWFVTNQVTSSSGMFVGDANLVWWNGTVFDSNYTDKEYARIDGRNGLSWYFTYLIKLNFDSDGGTPVNSQKFKAWLTGTKPTDPTKTWNTFLGWYTSDEQEFDFSQPIFEPTQLYAKWQIKQYTITFDADGWAAMDPIDVNYGDNISVPNPTRNGYRFIGWEPSLPATMPAENLSVKAKWEKLWSSGWWGWGGWSIKPDTSKIDNTPTETTEQSTQNEEKNIQDSSEQASQNDNNSQMDSSAEASEWQSNSQWTSTYSTEFQQAYEFAHENGITTKSTIESAQMNWKLTRIAMAKMLSQYAINVLGKEPDTTQNIKFNDVSDKRNADYDNWVTLAYQLWIMWQNMKDNNFRPDDEVTRAEFATALSRLLYSTSDGEYKSTAKYYIHHMEKLKEEWIITKDDPKMKELRGYVMIMLMRSAK